MNKITLTQLKEQQQISSLDELNRMLDDWCDVKVVPNNGDGDELNLTTKSKVDYFNEHEFDEVTFITQRDGHIVVFTERR